MTGDKENIESRRTRLRINGQVQGVGFRPFVYRLAVEMRLGGWVINDARGVTIELQGAPAELDEFARRLRSELPPLAQIATFAQEDVPPEDSGGSFEIRSSEGGELTDAQVTVDTAVCADCLREMADPADPRYNYPFINCTNCGPRYTIVTAIPYDRPNTTMIDFPMCPLCRREYTDPACRRFHAQPIACPTCGPTVWLVDSHGVKVECDNVFARTAAMLADGKIVAIKGLGGFHLACRADDDHAVRRLRQRKHRDAKPFAVMVANLDMVRRMCDLTDEAAALLSGIIRPIVILPMKRHAAIAPAVCQGLPTLGVMLPYTPLHFLLFAQPAVAHLPLVMTSGNFSDEPLVNDNDDAIAHMGRLADYLLLHNRRIERRLDDSVVQLTGDGQLIVLRRARGYAPQPVRLDGNLSFNFKFQISNFKLNDTTTKEEEEIKAKEEVHGRDASETHGQDAHATNSKSILAVGGELKSTVCLLKSGRAVLSEHIGDLKDGRVYRHFIDTINHLEKLFEVSPTVLAADLHPQYLSTQYAIKRMGRTGQVVRVQHHFAHIAACMAENGHSGPVIGLACDGTGYGDDGAVWGCEIFQADYRDYRRLGHLRYIPLPGGDLAADQTYRPALAVLYDSFGGDWPSAVGDVYFRATPAVPNLREASAQWRIAEAQLNLTMEQLTQNVNCPRTSSLGRWFDAVAGLTGVAEANDFEGQAPMLLESAIKSGIEGAYEFHILETADGEPFQIDLRQMVEQVVHQIRTGADIGIIAARFHNTVTAFLVAAARRSRDITGLATVALSGGCFANRYITTRLSRTLETDGFKVLRHRTIPCNDGCVALGQAVVAAARTNSDAGK